MAFKSKNIKMSESNQQLLNEFLIYLSQNKAPNSVSTYKSALHLISNIEWLTCSQSDLMSFRNDYVQKVSPNTASNRIILIKNFFKYLVKSNKRQDNPSIMLEIPPKEKGGKNEYELVSKDVYKEILEDIGVPLTTRLAIALGIGCGLRISEICNLRVEDIDLLENTLWVVNSKRNKSRELPIPDFAMYLIHRQIERLGDMGEESGYLLRNRSGKKLSTNAMQTKYNKVKIKYGIEDFQTFHFSRHFYGTQLVNNPNVSLPVASEALGHESWKTTEIYRHKDKEQLKSQVLSAINNVL